MVLCSECERIVYLIELTIPFQDAIQEAFERKALEYAELVAEVTRLPSIRQWRLVLQALWLNQPQHF